MSLREGVLEKHLLKPGQLGAGYARRDQSEGLGRMRRIVEVSLAAIVNGSLCMHEKG